MNSLQERLIEILRIIEINASTGGFSEKVSLDMDGDEKTQPLRFQDGEFPSFLNVKVKRFYQEKRADFTFVFYVLLIKELRLKNEGGINRFFDYAPSPSSKLIMPRKKRTIADSVQQGTEKFKNELVLGIVAPVGADLKSFEELVDRYLPSYGYASNVIKLSDFLKSPEGERLSGVRIDLSSTVNRYSTLMKAGNEVRKNTKANDFLAQYVVAKIATLRETDKEEIPIPLKGRVHLLHSLKHKEEVQILRDLYGVGFFLIGVYCHEEQRRAHLRRNGASDPEASTLIFRDYDDNQKYGQQTSKVYELADVFIHLDLDNLEKTGSELERFFDLIFGNPFRTPSKDENAMFLAYAASLRSGSLARQIGAVITSSEGEIIATGTNDVPRYGGGQYWAGVSDQRDFARGFDSNTYQRNIILKAVIKAVRENGLMPGGENNTNIDYTEEQLFKLGKDILVGTPLFDLTEFGRDVHAEMEALLCCARIGVSPKGGVLYTTTFPCHNCAKHIVAAGIHRVVYVEPYPKSKAKELHSDSIEIESPHKSENKVRFEPFVGVGPRRYFDLFSLGLGTGRVLERKNSDGKRIAWHKGDSFPRVQMLPTSYLERERLIAKNIQSKIQ